MRIYTTVMDNIDYKVIKGNNNQEFKDINDVIYHIKSQKREMLEKIELLENEESFESQKELAVLVRKVQYFDALLGKNKLDLEKIFFPNGTENCIIPEVLNWYNGSQS